MGGNNTSSKVQSALKPANISTPFGDVSVGKNSKAISYNPIYQPGQQQLLGSLDQNAANLTTNDIPNATQQYEDTASNYLNNVNSLTANNEVNPQQYQAMLGLETQPLLTNYQNQNTALNNQLAAENLTGGSYDALQHNYLNQNLNLGLNNAANQAITQGLAGTQAYLGLQNQGTQTAGQEVGALSGLAQNYQTQEANLQSQLLQPFQAETNYQSSVLNPLDQNLANYYSNSAFAGGQGLGTAIGVGADLLAAIPTGGASLALLPAAAAAGGAIGGGLSGGAGSISSPGYGSSISPQTGQQIYNAGYNNIAGLFGGGTNGGTTQQVYSPNLPIATGTPYASLENYGGSLGGQSVPGGFAAAPGYLP